MLQEFREGWGRDGRGLWSRCWQVRGKETSYKAQPGRSGGTESSQDSGEEAEAGPLGTGPWEATRPPASALPGFSLPRGRAPTRSCPAGPLTPQLEPAGPAELHSFTHSLIHAFADSTGAPRVPAFTLGAEVLCVTASVT